MCLSLSLFFILFQSIAHLFRIVQFSVVSHIRLFANFALCCMMASIVIEYQTIMRNQFQLRTIAISIHTKKEVCKARDHWKCILCICHNSFLSLSPFSDAVQDIICTFDKCVVMVRMWVELCYLDKNYDD